MNELDDEGTTGQEGGGGHLRIDRWLWCTRLFKSRTLAAEAVAGGKVHINGRRVKPAHPVRVGDHVAITRQGFEFECEVKALPDRRGSAPMAQACYVETEKAQAARQKYSENARLAAAFAPHSDVRPDKHARRTIRRLRGRES
jgi:ribosome-associated heat shock protein Hsp15